ncbi:ATPase P [candidate division KSB1 bacterium 4572_119]|nr:MAG: ATPase P [candidate division KSB1 bacterium 4572_119]
MILIQVPGFGEITLKNIVFDFNGTMAVQGKLIDGVRERLTRLAENLKVYVLTADTFGKAAKELEGLPCKLHILSGGNEDAQKESYVQKLGAESCCAFGNGNNDKKMLRAAKVGIAVIEGEGCSSQAVLSSDIIVKSILNGLDMLLDPNRLKATTRF